MCKPSYYTHQQVEAAFKTITKTDDASKAANVTALVAAEKLIGETIPFLGMASIQSSGGNQFNAVSQAITAGFVLGLRLSGTDYRVDPDQKDTDLIVSAKLVAQGIVDQVDALEYQKVAATAAAA